MVREKKKKWQDYQNQYSTYQFRIDKNDKEKIARLLKRVLANQNKKNKADEKKVTRGQLATEILVWGLEAKLLKEDKND